MYDKDFRKFANEIKHGSLAFYNKKYTVFADKSNWSNPMTQLGIYLLLASCLRDNKIKFIENEHYLKKARDYCSVMPNWLNDNASEWVEENILPKVPQGLNKAERKKMGTR